MDALLKLQSYRGNQLYDDRLKQVLRIIRTATRHKDLDISRQRLELRNKIHQTSLVEQLAADPDNLVSVLKQVRARFSRGEKPASDESG